MNDAASKQSATGRAGRVAVVGAGLSGLVAASELARRGFAVTVFEASATAGGRCGGETVDGHAIERQLPLFYQGDQRIVNFIRDVGLGQRFLPARPVQTAQLTSGDVRPIFAASPWQVAAIPGVNWWQAGRLVRLPRLMKRHAALLSCEAPERAADLDYRSAQDFGKLYFGQTIVDRLIAPSLPGFAEPQDLSRVAFLLDWLARDQGTSKTLLLRAGLSELTVSVARSLGVRLRHRALRIEDNGRGGYALAVQSEAGESTVEAEAVVLATAADEARRIAAPLLTLAEHDALGELRRRPAITLCVGLDREVTGIAQEIRIPRGESPSLRTLLVDPGGAGLRAPRGKALLTVQATDAFCETYAGLAEDVVAKTLLGELERVHPRSARRAAFTRIWRAENAVPDFRVGTYRVLRRFADVQADRRALGRRLYFAGSYRIGPRPEDAVASGLRAAAEAIADVAS